MSGNNPLEMSDEDFLKLDSPPVVEEASGKQPGAEPVQAPDPVTPAPDGGATDDKTEEGKVPDAETEGEEDSGTGDKPAGTEGSESDSSKPATEKSTEEEKPEGQKPEGTVPAVGSGEAKPVPVVNEPTPVDHKAVYDKVMAPFVANGKTIQVKTPEEALALMQMGANYTRKMQAIQPHRKMLTMLESNDLLDEDRLSFLIDLDKKNPEAIKKLIKDAGINPLEIDVDTEPNYSEGNHKVSDTEVQFKTNLEEVTSTPSGQETVKTILSTWDQASKEVLWGEPSILPIIHAQKDIGIYDRISDEVDRRRTLGKIAPEIPFLKAYQDVGDELFKAGTFDDLIKPATTNTTVNANPALKVEAEPIATRTAAPKPTVENGDKASAASPTRSTPTPAKAIVNPLAMSDDEFMANFGQFQGRV